MLTIGCWQLFFCIWIILNVWNKRSGCIYFGGITIDIRSYLMISSKGILKWFQFQFMFVSPCSGFRTFPLLATTSICILYSSFCFVGVYLKLQLCVWFPVLLISFLNINMLLSLHENVLFKFSWLFYRFEAHNVMLILVKSFKKRLSARLTIFSLSLYF